jgi:hypothetical protein
MYPDHLVADSTTMLAPYSIGQINIHGTGVVNNQHNIMLLAMAAMASKSGMLNFGCRWFQGMALVLLSIGFSNSADCHR